MTEGLHILYKNDVLELIQSDWFAKAAQVPISKIRAASQANNPKLNMDKPMLLVQMEKGVLVGYLGAYHDSIYIGAEKKSVAWTNDLWVHPNYRGKGIAQKLVENLYQQFEGYLMVADYVPGTLSIYEKTGQFVKLNPIQGQRVFLKRPTDAWLKNRFTNIWKRYGFKLYMNLHEIALPIKELKGFEIISELNDKHQQFIDKTILSSPFKNNIIQWQHWLDQPWLSEHEKEDRFYFSTHSNPFKQIAFELKDEKGGLAALVFIMVRGEELKVKQVYASTGFYGKVLETIVYMCHLHGCTQLTIFDRALNSELKNYRKNYITSVRSQKHILCGKSIYELVKENEISPADGDLVFT